MLDDMKKTISVNKVPALLWHLFKVRAAERDITVRDAVIEALHYWLKKEKG